MFKPRNSSGVSAGPDVPKGKKAFPLKDSRQLEYEKHRAYEGEGGVYRQGICFLKVWRYVEDIDPEENWNSRPPEDNEQFELVPGLSYLTEQPPATEGLQAELQSRFPEGGWVMVQFFYNAKPHPKPKSKPIWLEFPPALDSEMIPMSQVKTWMRAAERRESRLEEKAEREAKRRDSERERHYNFREDRLAQDSDRTERMMQAERDRADRLEAKAAAEQQGMWQFASKVGEKLLERALPSASPASSSDSGATDLLLQRLDDLQDELADLRDDEGGNKGSLVAQLKELVPLLTVLSPFALEYLRSNREADREFRREQLKAQERHNELLLSTMSKKERDLFEGPLGSFLLAQLTRTDKNVDPLEQLDRMMAISDRLAGRQGTEPPSNLERLAGAVVNNLSGGDGKKFQQWGESFRAAHSSAPPPELPGAQEPAGQLTESAGPSSGSPWRATPTSTEAPAANEAPASSPSNATEAATPMPDWKSPNPIPQIAELLTNVEFSIQHRVAPASFVDQLPPEAWDALRTFRIGDLKGWLLEQQGVGRKTQSVLGRQWLDETAALVRQRLQGH